MAHALKEEFVFLIFEGSEGFGGVVFCPALRVGLDGVVEETSEGCGEVGGEGGELEVGGYAGGLGYEKVVSMLEGFA